MTFSDQTSIFTNESLLTYQNLEQMADNDAFLENVIQSIPYFAAYSNSNQAIVNGGGDKLEVDTEEFDSLGQYDSVTNYRFTPLVAGKYLLLGRANLQTVPFGIVATLELYKNGAVHRKLQSQQMTLFNKIIGMTGAAIIDANGSTDYFELYLKHTHGANITCNGGQSETYFAGGLILAR